MTELPHMHGLKERLSAVQLMMALGFPPIDLIRPALLSLEVSGNFLEVLSARKDEMGPAEQAALEATIANHREMHEHLVAAIAGCEKATELAMTGSALAEKARDKKPEYDA